MKPLDPLLLAHESWRPAETFSGRVSNRTCERELDRVPASARLGDFEAPVKLWDFSPTGFAILTAHEGHQGLPARIGDVLSLRLGLAGQSVTAECVVVNVHLFRGQLRLGLGRRDIAQGPAFLDHPGALRLPEAARPDGEVDNPILYGEACPVRLAALLPGPRLAFVSDDPTLLLLRGQRLAASLILPGAGTHVVRGRVRELARPEAEVIAFLLEGETPEPGFLQALAEYLALETATSAAPLQALGIPALFRKERLELRLEEAPRGSGPRHDALPRLTPWSPPDGAFRNPSDTPFRVLAIRHGTSRLGEVELAFPESADALEVRGLSVRAGCLRADLLMTAMAHLVRVAALAGRRRIHWPCAREALPVLRILGFRVEDSASPPGAVLDVQAVLGGYGLPALRWLALYSGLRADLERKGLLAAPAPLPMRVRLGMRLGEGFLSRLRRSLASPLDEALGSIAREADAGSADDGDRGARAGAVPGEGT